MSQQTLDLHPDKTLANVFRKSEADLRLGIQSLQDILDSKNVKPDRISTAWFNAMRGHSEMKDDRIKWVWDTLRNDRRLRDHPTLNDAVFSFHDVPVFNADTWLVLVVTKKHGNKAGSYPPDQQLPVLIQINEQLTFKSGKSGKMDCRDCRCTLFIPVPELIEPQRQAEILSVSADQLDDDKHSGTPILTIDANSLNQAYTLASRKLEPERKSHGGRAYDRIWHVVDKQQESLLKIRDKAERGNWSIPKLSKAPENYTSAVELLLSTMT